MIAPAVFVAMVLDWWPRLLSLADRLGAAVEERSSDGEIIIFTGRSLAGHWVELA